MTSFRALYWENGVKRHKTLFLRAGDIVLAAAGATQIVDGSLYRIDECSPSRCKPGKTYTVKRRIGGVTCVQS